MKTKLLTIFFFLLTFGVVHATEGMTLSYENEPYEAIFFYPEGWTVFEDPEQWDADFYLVHPSGKKAWITMFVFNEGDYSSHFPDAIFAELEGLFPDSSLKNVYLDGDNDSTYLSFTLIDPEGFEQQGLALYFPQHGWIIGYTTVGDLPKDDLFDAIILFMDNTYITEKQ